MPELRVPTSELRQLVYVLASSVTGSDAAGQPIVAWKKILKFWSKIEPSESLLSSTKKLLGPQVLAEATHVVTMPYWAPLTARHRLQYGLREFEISSVTNVHERNVLNIAVVKERK